MHDDSKEGINVENSSSHEDHSQVSRLDSFLQIQPHVQTSADKVNSNFTQKKPGSVKGENEILHSH